MNQHGFEGNFLTEVPEYLKCVVCQLVLRKPVQILKCGHRFCRTCFDSLQNHAANANEPLCCPLDREIVDIKNTFEDTGMARIVANLRVKCPHSEEGCPWIGDLKDSASHEEQCHAKETRLKNPVVQQTISDDAVNELVCRLNKVEDDALKKEKEILLLKDNHRELRKQLDEKESDISVLQKRITHLTKEVHLVREDFPKRNKKESDLVERINLLEERLSSLEDSRHKQLDVKESDIASLQEKRITHLENQVHLVCKDFTKRSERESDVVTCQCNVLEKRLSSIENRFPESRRTAEGEMKTLYLLNQKDNGKERKSKFTSFVLLPVFIIIIGFSFQNMSRAGNERLGLKTQLANLNHTLRNLKKANDQFSNKIDTMAVSFQGEKTNIEDKMVALRKQIVGFSAGIDLMTLKKNVDNTEEKVDEMVHQVLSIENIYLANTGGRPRDRTVVQWKVHDFQHLSSIGERCYSPVFRTQIKEYSFKIYVHWSGFEKENVGLSFRLLRSEGIEKEKDLPPFTFRHKFQVIGARGNVVSENDNSKYASFRLRSSEMTAEKFGWYLFLKAQDLDQHLVDDTLTLRCTLYSVPSI